MPKEGIELFALVFVAPCLGVILMAWFDECRARRDRLARSEKEKKCTLAK